jgi:hypothetical protein
MTGVVEGRASYRGHIRRFDAVFGGPIWWAAHLGGSYYLAPRMCVWGTTWPKHLLTTVLVVLIGRAFLSGLQLVRAGRAAHDEPGAARDIFIGWIGMALASFFGAVTVAEWFPILMIDPCA